MIAFDSWRAFYSSDLQQVYALWVVPALEFFPLDQKAEPFKAPGGMVTPYPDLRHYTAREYGTRVGFFRFLKVFEALGIKASVPMNAAIAERYPFIVEQVISGGHEIIGHSMTMNSRRPARMRRPPNGAGTCPPPFR